MNAPLAECVDYDGLRKAINAVRELRNISFEQLDDLSGLPDRYSAKLFGPRPLRRIGMKSLGDLLGALGIKLHLVEDLEALAKVEKRFVARDASHVASVMRGGTTHIVLSKRHMSQIQAKGRRSRWGKMTDLQKTKWGKRLAKSRWREMKRRAKQRKAAHKARKKI